MRQYQQQKVYRASNFNPINFLKNLKKWENSNEEKVKNKQFDQCINGNSVQSKKVDEDTHKTKTNKEPKQSSFRSFLLQKRTMIKKYF